MNSLYVQVVSLIYYVMALPLHVSTFSFRLAKLVFDGDAAHNKK